MYITYVLWIACVEQFSPITKSCPDLSLLLVSLTEHTSQIIGSAAQRLTTSPGILLLKKDVIGMSQKYFYLCGFIQVIVSVMVYELSLGN